MATQVKKERESRVWEVRDVIILSRTLASTLSDETPQCAPCVRIDDVCATDRSHSKSAARQYAVMYLPLKSRKRGLDSGRSLFNATSKISRIRYALHLCAV